MNTRTEAACLKSAEEQIARDLANGIYPPDFYESDPEFDEWWAEQHKDDWAMQ